MGKQQTPKPDETHWGFGCFIWLAVYSAFILVFLSQGIKTFKDYRGLGIFWWIATSLLLIPFLLAFLNWLKGKALLFHANRNWDTSRIYGILTMSNSPNWKEYIEQNWIAKFGEHFIVMNYSDYHSWKPSLEAKICNHFLGRPNNYYSRNYNPAIILFRGLRRPYLYRFFYAFRDSKHGNSTALEKLENHLAQEFGKRTTA